MTQDDLLLGGNSTAVNIDSSGRITIPEGLRKVLGTQQDIGSHNSTDLLKITFENPAEGKRASLFLEISSDGRVTILEGVREYLEVDVDDRTLLKIKVEYSTETPKGEE